MITAGSAVLVGALWTIYRLQPALFTATLVMGGMVWLAGNFLWLYGLLIPQVVLWWAGFLILTIAGERLELSRLLRLSGFASGSFALLSLLMLAGMALSVVNLEMGTRIAGRPCWAWRSGCYGTTSPAGASRPAARRVSSPSVCSPATSGSVSAVCWPCATAV